MATNMKTSQHNRSNSVPSSSHPFMSQHDEHLNRFKASQATSCSSSSSSISLKLNGLIALQDNIDKMLQLVTIQQALAQESCRTKVDELLEGSLRLLDICDTAKDVMFQSKEIIHGLHLVIRRRGVEAAFKTEGNKYLSLRKKVKKTIHKSLECFKKGLIISTSSNIDDESMNMIIKLKEAEVVTMIELESLLSFISSSSGKSKENKWPVVSKLMQPKRVCCESDPSNSNEFEKLDRELQIFFHKPSSVVSVEKFQDQMENLEVCIQGLEEGIENLERQLIRSRVSLLNIYNH